MLAEHVHNTQGKILRLEYITCMKQERLDNVTSYLIIFLDCAIAS